MILKNLSDIKNLGHKGLDIYGLRNMINPRVKFNNGVKKWVNISI